MTAFSYHRSLIPGLYVRARHPRNRPRGEGGPSERHPREAHARTRTAVSWDDGIGEPTDTLSEHRGHAEARSMRTRQFFTAVVVGAVAGFAAMQPALADP